MFHQNKHMISYMFRAFWFVGLLDFFLYIKFKKQIKEKNKDTKTSINTLTKSGTHILQRKHSFISIVFEN